MLSNRYLRTTKCQHRFIDIRISGSGVVAKALYNLKTFRQITRVIISLSLSLSLSHSESSFSQSVLQVNKRKCCNSQCPDSVSVYTLLLILYVSAIETLICHRKMSLIGSASFVLHKI